MSYTRVIPRDLFNEGNLLKCYGQVYLNLEKMGLEGCLLQKKEGELFDIQQDQSDGSLTIKNIILFSCGREFSFKRPLNSRQPYPLYIVIDEEEIEVFNDDGSFTEEMVAFLKGKPVDG